MPEPLLDIQNMVAGYVPGLPILKEVSLAAEHGRLTVIIGPNGAGKSTLIKAVAGLLPECIANIRLENKEISGLSPDRLGTHGVAYVPQSDNVFKTLSVAENLSLALRTHPDREARLEKLYAQFPPLAQKRQQKAGSLSGGQRQFLAVAMALAIKPKLILMDEPSAGLSPKAVEEVLDHATQLTKNGVTILLVEQNVKQALKRADYCYILAEGRNQLDGPANELLIDPALARIYLGGERRMSA